MLASHDYSLSRIWIPSRSIAAHCRALQASTRTGAAIKFELLTIQNLPELDVPRLRINRETTRRRRRHVDICFLTFRKIACAAIVLESGFVGAACLGAVFSRASSCELFCCVSGIANGCCRDLLSGISNYQSRCAVNSSLACELDWPLEEEVGVCSAHSPLLTSVALLEETTKQSMPEPGHLRK